MALAAWLVPVRVYTERLPSEQSAKVLSVGVGVGDEQVVDCAADVIERSVSSSEVVFQVVPGTVSVNIGATR
jgi:hypothetical protein